MASTLLLLTALVSSHLGPPVVLENAAIRVEVQPEVCAIRYIGTRDGVNFVEPLPVRSADLRLGEPLDPGGVSWSIVPYLGEEHLLRGRPAEVVSHTARELRLRVGAEGKTPAEFQVRLTLSATAPELDMELTLLSYRDQPLPRALRTLWRVPAGAAVGYPEPVDRQGENTIYANDTVGSASVALTGATAALTLMRGDHVLRRQWDAAPPYRNGVNLVELRDPWTATAGIATESGWREVEIGAPLVHRERWIFSGVDE